MKITGHEETLPEKHPRDWIPKSKNRCRPVR